MQFGKRVERVSEDDAGVSVTFTDGTTAAGDFLIAADGSHSAVRPYVLGYTPERRYAGYVTAGRCVLWPTRITGAARP